MKYLLDTDTLIYFLKGQENVVKKMSLVATTELTTSIINYTELFYGAFNSKKKKQNIEKIKSFLDVLEVLPFCKESAHIFAELKAQLKRQGNIIADLDLMIASITLKNKCTLVTNNEKHFVRIKNIKLENWSITKKY